MFGVFVMYGHFPSRLGVKSVSNATNAQALLFDGCFNDNFIDSSHHRPVKNHGHRTFGANSHKPWTSGATVVR